MKAFLMHREHDFDAQQALPWNARALTQDLALDVLLEAAARDDDLVREVTTRTLLNGWANDVETVLYRQAVVQDGLANAVVVRELYRLVVETIEYKRQHYLGIWGLTPSSVLSGGTSRMGLYLGGLRSLRDLAHRDGQRFRSDGFHRLFAMLERELDEPYLEEIESHLENLEFRHGTFFSAAIGAGNVGRNYVLHPPRTDERHWLLRWIFGDSSPFSFRLHERDDAGARILTGLRDRATNLVANAIGQAADHVDSFFQMLRRELAFHVGCINLHERLTALGEPVCFPLLSPLGQPSFRCEELYDPCLALQMQRRVVGNTVTTRGEPLIVVTGANRGGKSVFLRSAGLAQLMMQAGMFVGARIFEAELRGGLFTHYRRDEDAALQSGKLDEELARLSEIIEHLEPNSLLLLNESFAATNEREGSEIARQVVAALLDKGMKVLFVTHLHAFARGAFERTPELAKFLRAQRLPDGTRTFRLEEGEPLSTSYGRDVFEHVFATP